MNAGSYIEPGCVENLIEGKNWLGPARGAIEDIAPLASLLNAGGMPTELVADPMGAVWSKFVFNCVMNPLGALMMGDNAARHDSPEMRALVDDMAAECTAVVEKLGGRFAFAPMDFVAKLRSGELPMSRHAGSMALDIARAQPTEIDELTGFIVREGERLGVPVPNCKAVYRLVKGLELAAQARVAKPR
jgi:2-dehydropantoate 2-reductase